MEVLVSRAVAPGSLREVLEASFAGRRVLVTGHSGFVGGWLSEILLQAGAAVVGVSLQGEAGGLGERLRLEERLTSYALDVRDAAELRAVLHDEQPEVVFHLAAQPLVLASYSDPVGTFSSNVMGTVHLLEAARLCPSARACVVVTSDKCYAPGPTPHVEGDPLGGDDPYSASKAAAELVAHAYRSPVLCGELAIATARAGNILGGGDFAADRLVPDCVRAFLSGERPIVRYPEAVRPWQHVLEAVAGYLRLADRLLVEPRRAAGAWNFGPPSADAATVGEVVERFVAAWRALGSPAPGSPAAGTPVANASGAKLPERSELTLDSDRARAELGWIGRLDLASALEWTAAWYHSVCADGDDAVRATDEQIHRYLALEGSREDLSRADRLALSGVVR